MLESALAMMEQPAFLVVEDDAHVGRTIARALSPYGSNQIVDTVESAFAALDREEFAAIVVDVGLPDGSGLDVLARARARSPEIAALVLSGLADADRLATAHALEAHYLLKPVDNAQIQRFAGRVRERHQAAEEKLRDVIVEWEHAYDLTPAECAVLELAASGVSRGGIAPARGVAPSTVKKQVQHLLNKTGDTNLESAAARVLRTALSRTG
jgi:DNA-binding NarL/FixJ family response regulator